ncbi:hypothetical protein BD310DRAFT_3908 [Dichomitus squalens]|uniref:Uncharacterized protein n=1 Tax=Dichomitus squalens TaxID=114155 RepID=A0A4Q9QC69_9APHY|nr:hypothetical protein BD310DRAFT_3908 [Dichomitus squalens]
MCPSLVCRSQAYTFDFASCRFERVLCGTKIQGRKLYRRRTRAPPWLFTHGRNGDISCAAFRRQLGHAGAKATSLVSIPLYFAISPLSPRIPPSPNLSPMCGHVDYQNASDEWHPQALASQRCITYIKWMHLPGARRVYLHAL